ncbi:RNA 2',3'-cyclic phosphodiesterase [Fredinandcohnia sp. 179-A 10B2 NHS]|uniref:RNA 2',3'-cyclic phosphodiesterase n=1 Tax=Fredinandcohnia sp. 179-A 10B2 NHS TaxID=3235176 RepID=UPI00399F188B
MEHQTHYFLALAIPEKTKEVLFKWRELLEPRLPFKSWVHPEDLHITLAFLGGTASFQQLNEVKKSIKVIVQQHTSFELELNGIGTFGRKDAPRILWAGANKSEELISLQKDVFKACTEVGFDLDKRPYSPHITLARRWKSDEKFPFETVNEIVQPKQEYSIFEAENVVLYQTHMNRTPKYQPLAIFPLS